MTAGVCEMCSVSSCIIRQIDLLIVVVRSWEYVPSFCNNWFTVFLVTLVGRSMHAWSKASTNNS
jgi:hypothetical protein